MGQGSSEPAEVAAAMGSTLEVLLLREQQSRESTSFSCRGRLGSVQHADIAAAVGSTLEEMLGGAAVEGRA
jgi:hypothetical protein